MEAIITLISLCIFGVLIVIPIILLVKVSSLKDQLFYLQKQSHESEKKLMFLINNMARKDDLEKVMSNISTDQVKKEEPVESTQEEETTIISQEVIQEEPVEQKEADTTPILPTEPIVVEKSIEEKAEEEPIIEEQETEPVPPLAAMSREEPQVVITPIEVPRPQTPAPVKDRTPQKNLLERILGDNWLSKVGIVTLVLGIGFFVKYAIDQNWINEIGRVGIGLLTGGIIIGVAHKLKKEYHVFSSILVGGGVSVFYITITLAFREYAIFDQTIAFVLLTVITIFSVIISLFYNRQELAIFSLVGGFLSPLMVSTGEGNYIVLFSFLLILNTGMLIISLKKDWKLVGGIAYVLSLIFFWSWLLIKLRDENIGATIFASLFFIQFYALAIIQHYKASKKMSIYQALLILTNNLSIFFACMYIFSDTEYNIRGIITLIIAAANAIVMVSLFRQTRIDRNMIFLIIALVMSLVSLAIPIQLRGHVITMFWAAETVLLLWLWQRSKINVFRFGFLAIATLSIFSYLMDINYNYWYTAWELPIIVNKIFITGVVLIAAFAINFILLRKEPKDSYISLRGQDLFKMSNITNVFKFALIALIFLVPYLELNHQLGVYTDVEYYTNSFRYTSLATYACLFICALVIVFKDKMNKTIFGLFTIFLMIYLIGYSAITIELREDIFLYQSYTKSSYFLVHFLSLLAIGYIYFILIKNIKTKALISFKVSSWILVIIAVAILSVELDHLIIWLFSDVDSYYSLLESVHNIGYPILWGTIAMILMIWGLKKKEVILRQISLISFGLIIIKFYAYDVWKMSQTGRISSFVILGVILLIVSFLQQKIKVLVKEDEGTEIDEQNTDQQL